MRDGSGGNISEIVNNIACELAKKKLNFKESDKNDQSKLALLSLEISKQQEEVRESIDGIYNTIKAQYFSMILPQGIKQEVAEYVFMQVNKKDLYSMSEIEFGDATVKEILISALQKNDEIKSNQVTSSNNSLESFKVFKSENKEFSDINGLLAENENLRNKISPQAFYKSHTDNATQNDKELAVVMMGIAELDTFILSGMNFDELESFDQQNIVNSIKVLVQSGNSQIAQNYMSVFGITEETLKDTKFSNFEFNQDTNNAEMDETARKINLIADRVKFLITYYDKLPEDKRKILFTDLKESINKSDYPIDGILEGFVRVGDNIDLDNPYHSELLEILTDKLKDENSELIIDGYVTKNFMLFSKDLMGKDIKLASELIDLFNNRIDKEFPKISIEMLKILKSEDIWNITDNNQLEQNGTELIVKESLKNNFNDRYGKNPTSTIKDATQFLTIPIDSNKKEYLKNIMLNTLLIDETEREDEELKNAKKNLFKTIIRNEIQDRNPVDESLITMLTAIDKGIVKDVLSESLLARRNISSSPSDPVLNAYISALESAIKEANGKEVLDANKTNLGKLSGSNQDFIKSNSDNMKNKEIKINSKEVPDERE